MTRHKHGGNNVLDDDHICMTMQCKSLVIIIVLIDVRVECIVDNKV